jgi:protease-4
VRRRAPSPARRALGACLALLGLGACFNRIDVDLGLPDMRSPLQETVVLGERGPKIALVEISGVISDTSRSGALGLLSAPSMVAELREALDLAADDSEVGALVLRIESPGGSVAATETLHHEIRRWREQEQRPVVAYLNGIAASGGYYVAMAADRVIAHPATVTGSIGVIMPGLGLSGLMDRFGVTDQTIKSGEYKDVGSPTHPMTAREREHLQGIVDGLYERFVEVVDDGRPGLDHEQTRALADGRLFTARQALDLGLIDAIGYVEDAVTEAERSIGAGESRVIMYERPGRPKENIHSRAPVAPAAQAADLPLAAGFYYLWPAALRD